jgi:hypothetical protein
VGFQCWRDQEVFDRCNLACFLNHVGVPLSDMPI